MRIVLWCSFVLTALLVLAGTILKTSRYQASAEKFDALYSEKKTYSYIDVIGISDWRYEYTYNDADETFYMVLDTDGCSNFATISYDDFSQMRQQRLYWEGQTETVPEPYRIYGEAWSLNASEKTQFELYKVSGAQSMDEFTSWFGYISAGRLQSFG